jgi:putative ABC transport system permease protein
VYSIRAGDFFPDDRLFGVMWMGRDALSAALDMRGAFNDLTLTLSAGASEPEVIAAVDTVLAPYGAIGAYGRSKQISDWFVSSELDQLRGSAIAVPSIFLAVAAFLLNIVIARVVGAQRTQIATLKAFGYSGMSIGAHYLKMALSIVFLGTVLGAAGGVWLAAEMTQLYARYFRFPVLDLVVSVDRCVMAVLVAVVSATAGVVTSVKHAMALPPAQAMLPEAPPAFRRTLVERLGLHRHLPNAWRMVLRNIERRPVRALLSGIGMAFATAILVLGMCMQDAIELLMDQEFRTAQRQDALVLFTRPTPSRAMQDLLHMPGVLSVEPFRSVGVTLRSGHLSYSTSILGMPSRPELRRILDRQGRVLELPREGLVLTTELGRMLGVDRGDVVTVELMEDRRQTRQMMVGALIDTFLGVSGYMEIDALRRVLHEGDTISGAAMKVDTRAAGELYLRLKRTPGVMGVGSKQAALEGFERTIAENQGVSTVFEIGFAVLIAFAVVYNGARIALAERSRELASLRVLGFTRAETSAILLGELGAITLAFIPGGLLLGYGLAALLVEIMTTELYRFPLVVSSSTYAVAAAIIVGSAAVSALIVRRRLDRLDLVAVLKTRD